MNIAIIAPEQLPVPPVIGGSVETCIHALTRKLAAHGHRVTVVSKAHPALPRRNRANGVVFIRVPRKSREHYLRSAIRAIRGKAFQIVQIENRPVFVHAIRRAFPRTRIVLSLHSQTYMFQLSRSYGDQVLSQVNAVSAVSSGLKATLANRHPHFRGKLFTAHPGVNTEKFKPVSAESRLMLRRKWGVSGTVNILFVGRIVPKKGLHTLVKAVARIRGVGGSVRLVVAGAFWPGKNGQTPYMRKVKQLSKRLGVLVTFTGYVPTSRMHQVYQLADVFVCPTQYQEGFGLVNTEAMASGIPIIASKRGGIPEIIRHGRTGLLVSAYRSPGAFAKAITSVLSNRALAARLSANGRKEVVRRFNWNHTATVYSKTYRKIRGRQ